MPSTLRISRRLAALTTRGRTYHATPRALRPHKDSKDRESENSGRDREMAGNSDAAFDPRKTRPESEGRTAEAWSNDDPPEANGANQELSKPRGDERSKADRGAGDQVRKGGRSGGGNTTKQGGPGRV